MSSPPSSTRPRRSTSPISALNVVVLPTPFRPSSAVAPPSATSKEIPCSTCDWPRYTCRSRTERTAIRAALRGRPAGRSVAHDRLRGVDRKQPAVVHDRDPLREPGHHLHVMLDHQHRPALVGVHRPDQLDELGHVLHRDARHRLVEQQDLRVAREQHRELELALVAVREPDGRHLCAVAETDSRERPVGAVDGLANACCLSPDPHRPAERRLRREAHVLERRQEGEHVRDLERPPDPRPRPPERRLTRDVLAVELDPPGRRAEQARDEVEECRLSRPVRPDHRQQLAVLHLEADIGDDRCAADVEPEALGCQDGCAHARVPLPSLSSRTGERAAPCRRAKPSRGRSERACHSSGRASP